MMNTSEAKTLCLYLLYASLFAYFASVTYCEDNFAAIFLKSIPNTLATVASLAAGAWITLAVVERALREDKIQLSKRLRKQTFHEIIDVVSNTSICIYISISFVLTQEEKKTVERIVDTIRNHEKDGKKAAEAIGEFAVLLNNAYPRIIEVFSKASEDQVKDYIEQIKLPFKEIEFDVGIYRTNLMPIVFDFSENADLRAALMNFHSASRKYEKYMRSFDDDLYAIKPGLLIFQSLIDLLDEAANVYWFIADDLEKDPR